MAADDRRAQCEERLAIALFTVVGVLVALSVSFLARDNVAAAWRVAGGLLELAGFSTVAIGLGRKVRPFTEGPPPTERARRFLSRAWRWILSKLGRKPEGRTVKLKASSGGHSTSGARGRISVRPADDSEVERWIEYLDEELQALRERVVQVSRKHRERMDRLEEKLERYRQESRKSDRQVEELVERIAVGSLRWETVGLAWYVLGVIATTWAPDLPFPLPVGGGAP